MKRLYAIDLDGTLFYPKHPIKLLSKRNVSFLKKIDEKGDIFAVVSGRSLNNCLKVFNKVGTKPYIAGCNGAYIYKENKIIDSCCIDGESIHKILDYIFDKYNPLTIHAMSSEGKTYAIGKYTPLRKIGFKIYDFFQGKLLSDYIVDEEKFYETIDKNKTWKLMIVFGIAGKAKRIAKEMNKTLFKEFGDICSSGWANQAIEITAKGCEKSERISKLAKSLGIDDSNVIVVGDSGNDIPMFKRFYENSFCMAHSPKSIKKYAKHTIKKVRELEKYF